MKPIFFILILILVGCTKNVPYEINYIVSNEKKYNSSRIRFSDVGYKEIEFEVLFLSKNTKCFLNFYYSSLVGDKDQVMKVSTGDQNLEELCHCMKGKQRLLLSDRLSEIIIDSLKDGKKISIIHNKSTINIDGQEFITAYEKAVKKNP